MPIVSGLVVLKMNPISHVGNIRLLHPVVVTVKRQEDYRSDNDHAYDVEKPKEILHIVSEIGFIVLLVSVLSPSTLINKHFIDLTVDLLSFMRLCGYKVVGFYGSYNQPSQISA